MEEYLVKYYNDLQKIVDKNEDEIEKFYPIIISISILATIGVLTQIDKLKLLNELGLFKVGYLMIFFALIVRLLTHMLSKDHCLSTMEYIRVENKLDDKLAKIVNRQNNLLGVFNFISFVMLGVGVFSLVYFVFGNI